jgi:hypothetical protein
LKKAGKNYVMDSFVIYADSAEDTFTVGTASSMHGNDGKGLRSLVPKCKRNRPLGRRRHGRKGNIKKRIFKT